MCNRYRPVSVVRYRDIFGFTYIESGPQRPWRAAIGPLQDGPFIRASGFAVGQWGLIPDRSRSRRPSLPNGRPMSTNNARFGAGEPEKSVFRAPWSRGQRCLVLAEDYDEPFWGTGRNIWWRFARADGMPWTLAGLWNDWTDPETGEVVTSYTMLTINCDSHPLLSMMHKPDPALPADKQDKRSVVSIEREHWDVWLHGSPSEAAALIRLPPSSCFRHGAAEAEQQVDLPFRP